MYGWQRSFPHPVIFLFTCLDISLVVQLLLVLRFLLSVLALISEQRSLFRKFFPTHGQRAVYNFFQQYFQHCITVLGDRYVSDFILLHLHIHISKHHLLKMWSFLHCVVRFRSSIWLHQSVLCQLTMMLLLPQFCNTSSNLERSSSSIAYFAQDCFGYLGSFLISCAFRDFFLFL